LVRPKSATLAPRPVVSRMLLLFTSLRINAGVHAVWRYSRPVIKIILVFETHAGGNLRNYIDCEVLTLCRITSDVKTLLPSEWFTIRTFMSDRN
jgi:hypothetical protein